MSNVEVSVLCVFTETNWNWSMEMSWDLGIRMEMHDRDSCISINGILFNVSFYCLSTLLDICQMQMTVPNGNGKVKRAMLLC